MSVGLPRWLSIHYVSVLDGSYEGVLSDKEILVHIFSESHKIILNFIMSFLFDGAVQIIGFIFQLFYDSKQQKAHFVSKILVC